MDEEKLYIGAKIITACPMDEFDFLRDYKEEDWTGRGRESRAGYRITYSGGYVSWSPKDVFETAYREITSAEKEML